VLDEKAYNEAIKKEKELNSKKIHPLKTH